MPFFEVSAWPAGDTEQEGSQSGGCGDGSDAGAAVLQGCSIGGQTGRPNECLTAIY